MKIKSENRSVIQSDYNLKSTNFAIRAEDSPIIMEMMRSKIYSNKPAAVVREYTTNALDEHKLHNISRPVELHAPTSNKPEFTVRDFGKGLTDQEVREIYVNYGCSTKRDTNDLTGGLGIGCKAGFAYGSQFSIISITKDDEGNVWKNSYIALIDESSTGTLKHVERSPDNSLETGVEVGVGIDISDIPTFGKEIWNLWLTCTDKPKILNPNAIGPIETIEQTISILKDHKYYRTYNNTDEFTAHNKQTSALAVMGNIGYPINNYHLNGLSHTEKSLISNPNLHIKFKIGELNIASNREELEYNKETINNLETAIKKVFNVVTKDIIDQVNPINCWMERQAKYSFLKKSVNRHVVQYVDKKLTDNTTGIYTNTNIPSYLMYQYKYHGGVNRLFSESCESHTYTRININPAERWIEDLRFFIVPIDTTKANITRRIKSYLESISSVKEACKLYVLFINNNESKKTVLAKYSLPYISDTYVLDLLNYEPLPANLTNRSSNSKSHVELFKYNSEGYTDTDSWKDAGTVSLSSSSHVLFTYLSSVHAIKPGGIDTKLPHANPEYRVPRELFKSCIQAFNEVSTFLTVQERKQLSKYLNKDTNTLDATHLIYGVRKNNWKVMKDNPNAINLFDITSKLLQRAVDSKHAESTLLSDIYQLRTCLKKQHSLNSENKYSYRDPKFSNEDSRSYRVTSVYKSLYNLHNSKECTNALSEAISLCKTKKRKLMLEKLSQFALACKSNVYINTLISNCIQFHNRKCLINYSNKDRLKPNEFITVIKNIESELPLLEASFLHITVSENRYLSDKEKVIYTILEDNNSDDNQDYERKCHIHKQYLINKVKEDVVKYMTK